MDALNRSLSWDLSSFLAYTQRQIHRYGDAEENLLTHMVSLNHDSPYHIRFYFPHSCILDMERICRYLDITLESKAPTQNCRLIDLLVIVVIFTNGSLQEKSNYLFDWFHLSREDVLDEYEMVFLLSRIRFCLRKLGLKTLEFPLDELKHIAFTSMKNFRNSYPLTVSRLEFQDIVEKGQVGRLLNSLVTGFRRINSIVNILSNRLSYLKSIQELILDQDFFVPGPPLGLFAASTLSTERVLVTFFDATHISLAVPRTFQFREIYIRIDRWHSALGSKESKPFAAAIHRRFEVDSAGARDAFARVDLDGLRPSTHYTVIVYTAGLHFPPVNVTTCPPLRDVVGRITEVAIATSIDRLSEYTGTIKEDGQNEERLKLRLVVFVGPICALDKVCYKAHFVMYVCNLLLILVAL